MSKGKSRAMRITKKGRRLLKQLDREQDAIIRQRGREWLAEAIDEGAWVDPATVRGTVSRAEVEKGD